MSGLFHDHPEEKALRRRRARERRWALVRTEDGPWYALRVVGGREADVVAALEGWKVKAWSPVEARWRRRGERRLKSVRPVFPGYVFVPLPDGGFPIARRVEGAIGFVLKGDAPAVVPAGFVAMLRRAEAGGLFDATRPRERPIEAQMRVKIRSGVFGGMFAKVERVGEDGRASVLMEAMGLLGGGKASFAVKELEPAPKPALEEGETVAAAAKQAA